MHAKVEWVTGLRFVGVSGSGHGVVMESKGDSNEAPAGPSPMEMVLLGLGGCSCVDVVDILRKMRQPLEALEVRLSAERAPEPPKYFTAATLEFVVTGRGLSEAQVKRAVDLSMEKYCSVAATLKNGGCKITYTWKVQEKAPAEKEGGLPPKPPVPAGVEPTAGLQPAPALPFPGPPGPFHGKEGGDR